MNYYMRIYGIIMFLTVLAFTACGGGGSDVSTALFSFNDADTAGQIVTVTTEGISFNMVYVPGGLTFPTGLNDDDGDETVTDAYFICETEVTYELWQNVYNWASTNGYSFDNPGSQGDNGSRGIQHPVTYINWRDAMVWCNALTEWYNAMEGINNECVYTYSSVVNRDSNNAAACDGVEVSNTAKGFRLLTLNEWELTARYRDGTHWTYGDHASGDDSGYCYDDGAPLGGMSLSTVFGNYAVYDGNSGSTTASVRSKTPNALGLYDMSGNVWEWCYDLNVDLRTFRGGSFSGTDDRLRIGYLNSNLPTSTSGSFGFRFAKTQ